MLTHLDCLRFLDGFVLGTAPKSGETAVPACGMSAVRPGSSAAAAGCNVTAVPGVASAERLCRGEWSAQELLPLLGGLATALSSAGDQAADTAASAAASVGAELMPSASRGVAPAVCFSAGVARAESGKTAFGRSNSAAGLWTPIKAAVCAADADGFWPDADGFWPDEDGVWPDADGFWPVLAGLASTAKVLSCSARALAAAATIC